MTEQETAKTETKTETVQCRSLIVISLQKRPSR